MRNLTRKQAKAARDLQVIRLARQIQRDPITPLKSPVRFCCSEHADLFAAYVRGDVYGLLKNPPAQA